MERVLISVNRFFGSCQISTAKARGAFLRDFQTKRFYIANIRSCEATGSLVEDVLSRVVASARKL